MYFWVILLQFCLDGWAHSSAVFYSLMFSPLQGDTVVDCYEVSAAEPFLSQGEPGSRATRLFTQLLPPCLRSHCLFFNLSVSHCLTDTSTRGVALVPKVALDVMSCEVIRVLQLTDSCIVPISYQVPRKVCVWAVKWWCPHTFSIDSSCIRVMCCFSSSNQARSFMTTSTQTRWAQLRPCLQRSGGREGTSR